MSVVEYHRGPTGRKGASLMPCRSFASIHHPIQGETFTLNIPIHSPVVLDCSDLSAFINQQRRLPRLGDAPPPWCYRGWLLPYIVMLHEKIPAVKDRWGYHLRTLEAGKLLDEPIPQIRFGPANEKVFGMLADWSRLIAYDCGGWSDFRTLMDWLCWALTFSGEAPRLS